MKAWSRKPRRGDLPTMMRLCWTSTPAVLGHTYCPACRTYEIATRFWVVVICPIIKCLTVLEFYFILFYLCLFITIFNFILNYVLIVTFWIFTYHKIWILLIIYSFIWNYWIIFFNMFGSVLGFCELTGVSLLWTRMALANKAKIGLVFLKLGIYQGGYFDCIIIINLRSYIDLLDTSVIVFVNNLLWFVFYFMLFA